MLRFTSNLIGRTIILTSEKYRLTNHRPQTKSFTSEERRFRFSRFLLSYPLEVMASSSRFTGISSVEEFIEEQENENTRKKTEQNIGLLKEFLTLKNESRAVEEIPPNELSSFISEFIITVRKKEDNKDYEPNSLRAMIASFERYLKKKKNGFSIMNGKTFDLSSNRGYWVNTMLNGH